MLRMVSVSWSQEKKRLSLRIGGSIELKIQKLWLTCSNSSKGVPYMEFLMPRKFAASPAVVVLCGMASGAGFGSLENVQYVAKALHKCQTFLGHGQNKGTNYVSHE